MKRKLSILILSIIVAGIISCRHNNTDVTPNLPGNNPDSTNITDEPDTSLCFERDILPIFVSNCAKSGCHDAASARDGYVFTSYATITAKKFRPGRPDDTELYEKITENDPHDIMPPPPNAPLTTGQISLIYEWIRRGAPNTTGCASNCDTTAFLFSKNIQPVLNQNCRGCHNSSAPSAGISLDNYAGVKSVVDDGRLIKAVNHLPGVSAMPKNGNKLASCKIRQIEKWVADGARNN